MGAISDLAAYKALRRTAKRYGFSKAIVGSQSSGLFMSAWLSAPDAGAAPGAAAACNRATVGSLLTADNVSSLTAQYWIVGWATEIPQSQGLFGAEVTILADRLSHQSGLSGTATGAQTTNLPTAALSRFTTGDDVQIGIEIYTAVGSTATTLTASYTNQVGTAGQTTKAVVFGGGTASAASRFITLPLADGDTGARAVASVTIAASTLTAGNFGVTLYKPHGSLPFIPSGGVREYDALTDYGARISELLNDACPFFITMTSSSSALTPVVGHLQLGES